MNNVVKPFALLAACLLTAAVFSILSARPASAGGPPPAPVEVAEIVEKVVQTKITLAGTAEAHRLITLASQVEGVVARGMVEEGDLVRAGQVVVSLDARRLSLRLSESKARLREAQALVGQMKRDLNRKSSLHRTKSVPLKDLEDARTDVERQEAVAQRIGEAAKLLEKDLADTDIRAPLNGVVVERIAYRGEWVAKGGPVLIMAVLDPLKVVVPVPERFLPNLKPGDTVILTADALGERAFKGRIQAVIPEGDRKSRTFPVQIRVENKSGDILPGMLVRAQLGVGLRHSALLIPKDALVVSPRGVSVVLVEQGRARPVEVKVIAAHGGLMEVKGPLAKGQAVVIKGNERVRPGQPVQTAARPGSAKAGKPAKKQGSKN